MPLSSANRAAFLEALTVIVGARHLRVDPADTEPCLTDWRGRYHGRALAVVRPETTEETAGIVQAARAYRVPMVPQGGNTGLCGGATPDAEGHALLIQLGRLNRVRAIDPVNNALTAEAGCTLAEVQAAAREADRLFPLSLASEGSCQIGGNLSTNAGGMQVLRYGTARDLTLGLEAVLPNGEIWHGLSALRKDNTGYDLRSLLIGAEGTLGIITAASLKLFPQPKDRVLIWLGLASPALALALLERVQAAFGAELSVFELICPLSSQLVRIHIPGAVRVSDAPWQVLCEFSGMDEADGLKRRLETFWAKILESPKLKPETIIIAQTEAQSRALWALREQISEAQKQEGVSVKHDIALPISRVAEFLEQVEAPLRAVFPDARHTAFGHLGDGNLHFNLSCADPEANARLVARAEEASRIVHDLVHRLGGSISAEHGIGQLKRALLDRYKSPAALSAMRAIRKALDPLGLMNPGKGV